MPPLLKDVCKFSVTPSTIPHIPPPSTTAPEHRRLSPFQRAFSGNRCSDHIATLNAFSAWEEARMGGEQSEIRFCDYKGLSMPTLRVIWEAKVRG